MAHERRFEVGGVVKRAPLWCVVIALPLLVTAAQWAHIETDHLAVFSCDEEVAASVASMAEETLLRVFSHWLPNYPLSGAERGGFPSALGNVSPELIERIRAEVGLIGYKAVAAALFLYGNPELYWSTTRAYGSCGISLSRPPTSGPLMEIGRLLQEARISPTLGVVMCLEGCIPGVLFHEFTHLAQFAVLSVPLDQWFPDKAMASLLLEGMAVWAEYALGAYPEAFEREVRQPVAYWLSVGGDLEFIPYGLRYEVGASLVGFLARELSPPEIMSLISPGLGGELGLPVGNDFAETFCTIYGGPWEDFIAAWRRHEEKLGVTPGGKRLNELYTHNILLRASFLWPLLSPLERELISSEAIRVPSDSRALERAEAILQGAWKPPSPGIMEAIGRRLAPLRRMAREISGLDAELAVMRLSARWASGECDPGACLREYVELVNRYLSSTQVGPRSRAGSPGKG